MQRIFRMCRRSVVRTGCAAAAAAVICATVLAPAATTPSTPAATSPAAASPSTAAAAPATRPAAVPLGTGADSPHYQRARALLREKNFTAAIGALHEAIGAD